MAIKAPLKDIYDIGVSCQQKTKKSEHSDI